MITFKKALRKTVSKTISLLNYFIPKKNNRIFFKSKPDYSGNCKALSDYIIENNLPYHIVWSLKKDINQSNFSKVMTGSLKEYYYYFTSKYIITTHNEMIGPVARNQRYISLWHGMPFKKICYLGENDYKGMIDYSAIRIATSEVMRSIISASFREKANNVYITGQPRNDFLFKPIELADVGLESCKNKKIIMLAPTFRMNNEDKRYSDGVEITDNNFLRVDDFSLNEIDGYLEKNNAHLILKLHPYEEEHFRGVATLSSNITIISSEELTQKNIDLNQLLSLIDILITDYSSIYLDYLILNKPIVFLVPDVDAYSSSRGGFTLEPFDFWTPGDKVNNQNSLLESIDKIISGNDEYTERRGQVNSIINKYDDANSSQRVVELMKSLS
ncbi:CDP-glycerol glycerophosphotransferase family protein [Cronobacter turicensis]|nr:CDP-glycerol glycerophosphotransferase family protein [Cronobacter turicensis]